MGPKRNQSVLAADDNDESSPQPTSNKRRRKQLGAESKPTEGRRDPTYGQRTAFPGLDGDEPAQLSDDDLEYEENGDVLAYLRAVRQEASSVPHVLVAPKAGPQLPPHLQSADDVGRSIYDSGVGDSRGYYHDGAYTAAPDRESFEDGEEEEEEGEEVEEGWDEEEGAECATNSPTKNPNHSHRSAAADLCEAYYASLTSRFLRLRALLRRPPPAHLVAALPPDHGTEVGRFGARSRTFRVWTRRIRHTDPLPAQVAALDRQAALRLLRVVLGGKFVRRGCELRERTSRWIWALLARLPDCGEMDYTEVGWVRELGKRAVLMMVSIAQMEALRRAVEAEDLEGEDIGEDDEDEGDEEEEQSLAEMVVDEGQEGEEKGEGGERISVAPRSVADNLAAGAVNGGTVSGPAAAQPTAAAAAADDGAHDGKDEQDELGEREMDTETDMEEGELSADDRPTPAAAAAAAADAAAPAGVRNPAADLIAAAKARLLARLEEETQEEEETPAGAEADEHHQRQQRRRQQQQQQQEEEEEEEDGTPDEADTAAAFDEARARLNMRATLNMILTVAGELYGQRDLLEFRDPFPAL